MGEPFPGDHSIGGFLLGHDHPRQRQKHFNLEHVDPFFQDSTELHYKGLDRMLSDLDTSTSEGKYCIEGYLTTDQEREAVVPALPQCHKSAARPGQARPTWTPRPSTPAPTAVRKIATCSPCWVMVTSPRRVPLITAVQARRLAAVCIPADAGPDPRGELVPNHADRRAEWQDGHAAGRARLGVARVDGAVVVAVPARGLC